MHQGAGTRKLKCKALYRRAQAYNQLADLELAEADIKKALEIEPHNKELISEYNTVMEIKKYHKRKVNKDMADRHTRYEIVEYDFDDVRTLLVCDGPEGPSLLTTLFNFIHCVYGWIYKPPHPYFEKHKLQDRVVARVISMVTFEGEKKESLHCDFKESHVTDLFRHLGFPLLHCWLVDPEDASVYRIIQNYSYEELQKYSVVLEKKLSGDDAHKYALIQKLLETYNKQMTSYGYTTLCENMNKDGLAVLYCDRKFHVMREHDGRLLLLETNSSILKDYPEVRWRVFEEVDRDTIYLNDHYMPANGQPNIERAVLWHQSKVQKPLSKAQRKRLRKKGNLKWRQDP